MANNKINGCPYQSSFSNRCSHKGLKSSGRRKRFCPYRNPGKCPLYNEWRKQRKEILEGLE